MTLQPFETFLSNLFGGKDSGAVGDINQATGMPTNKANQTGAENPQDFLNMLHRSLFLGTPAGKAGTPASQVSSLFGPQDNQGGDRASQDPAQAYVRQLNMGGGTPQSRFNSPNQLNDWTQGGG